jgi:hypothetical protein
MCKTDREKKTYQFEHVLKPLVSVLIRIGVISAGYNHVTPSHPIAKAVSYTKMNTVAAMAGLRLESVACDREAPMTSNESARPPAPNIIKLRRPKRSTTKRARQAAMKYSVPSQAVMKRESLPSNWSELSNTVVAASRDVKLAFTRGIKAR